jgi:hypothetical protein
MYRGDRELVLLALRGLGLIGPQCRDVDQSGDAVIGAGGGDDRSSVGVADQDDRVVDLPEVAHRRGRVVDAGVEPVLGRNHLVSLRLQRRDQFVEA